MVCPVARDLFTRWRLRLTTMLPEVGERQEFGRNLASSYRLYFRQRLPRGLRSSSYLSGFREKIRGIRGANFVGEVEEDALQPVLPPDPQLGFEQLPARARILTARSTCGIRVHEGRCHR